LERGDCSLISEAAFTGCFNFKEGSPLDQEYHLRLKLALNYLVKKRLAEVLKVKAIYNTLICLQRTVANASELAGDTVKDTLTKYVKTVLNNDTTEEQKIEDSEESIVAYYKAIYEQLYGTNDDQDNIHRKHTDLSDDGAVGQR
jgi:hypothetical protein